MPNRIAIGAAAWWEPVVAVIPTLAAVAFLVEFGSRVYAGAVLRTGPTLKLRDALERTSAATSREAWMGRAGTLLDRFDNTEARTPTTAHSKTTPRRTSGVVIAIAAILGLADFALAHDFIIGVIVGGAFYTLATTITRAREHVAH